MPSTRKVHAYPGAGTAGAAGAAGPPGMGSGDGGGSDFGMWVPGAQKWISEQNISTAYRAGTFATGMYSWEPGTFTARTDLTLSSKWYIFDWRSSANGFDASRSRDLNGWINPNVWQDDFYWGAEFPAGTSLILPKGTYLWFVGVNLNQDVPADQVIRSQIEIADEYVDNWEYNLLSGEIYYNFRPNDQFFYPYECSFSSWFVIPRDGFHMAPTLLVNAGAGLASGGKPLSAMFQIVKVTD